MSIKYPGEFIKRVRDEYPGRKDITQAVEIGGYKLGKLLQEGSVRQMPPEEVVRCFHEGEEDRILRDAQAMMRRRVLHADWMRMVVRRIETLETEPSKSQRSGIMKLRQRLLPVRTNGNGLAPRTPVLASAHKA